MKTGNVLQTGACGDVVASHNQYGSYTRKRPSRKKRRNKPRTADTDRAERDWRAISALWNRLSEEQYRAWEILSAQERSRRRAGKTSRLPPRNVFFRINNSRASLSLTLVADPPAPGNPGPNPIGPLPHHQPGRPRGHQAGGFGTGPRPHQSLWGGAAKPGRRAWPGLPGAVPAASSARRGVRHHPVVRAEVWRARTWQAGVHSHGGGGQRPAKQSPRN